MSEAKHVTILSFDPGTLTGWSYLEATWDGSAWLITPKDWGVLDGEKLSRTRKDIYKSFSKLFVRSEAFYFAFVELLVKYRPTYVVTEGAFSHKFPAVFASLLTVIHTLRTASRNIAQRDVNEIAPMVSKKMIAKKGNADKDDMERGLLSHKSIVFEKPVAKGELSEHAIDAICHGSAFLLSDMYKDAPVFCWRNDSQQQMIDALVAHVIQNASWAETLSEKKE